MNKPVDMFTFLEGWCLIMGTLERNYGNYGWATFFAICFFFLLIYEGLSYWSKR